MSAYLTLPYDRGFPWHLENGAQSAVVSERAASTLVLHGVPIRGSGERDETTLNKQAIQGELKGGTLKLSKKARAILAL